VTELRRWLWLPVVTSMASCSFLPRQATEVQSLPAAQTAQQLTVKDRAGAVSPQAERQALAQVRGEGRAALVQHHLGVLAAEAAAADGSGSGGLYRGNTARLLVDGPATFQAMKEAVAAARHRVLVEFYIVEDDGVAAEMAELLRRKAAEGVAVALLYDSIGSLGTDAAFFEGLRQAGVAVCEFNPVNPISRPGSWGLVQRNHRKMVAVDSDVAFTGGINLSQVYDRGSGLRWGGSSGSRKAGAAAAGERGWRDTQVELRGPVVTGMTTLFRETWMQQACKGTLPPAPPPTPGAAAPGQRVVQLVASDPSTGVNPTYTRLLRAVAAAQRSVYLTMAYFAPGPEMVQALADAALRGVDVQLVLPGRSDVALVQHAARSYYAQLLQAGAQIHEVDHAVMHAKTAVVDGVFSTVGSSNLDWRSIVGNNEIDVIVLGDDFGSEMEALFRQDVGSARAIDAPTWQRRGLRQRLLEGLGRALEPLL
jgi:cardiolipin synthase